MDSVTVMKCTGARKSLFIITAIVTLVQFVTASTNYGQCITRVNNMTIDGKMDNQGRPLSPSSNNATAISYELCVTQCGADQEPFQWAVFSQQFSAWLLPWLALISQLPFGANDAKYNLESMLLTVGCPTLAAYSLFLTALNGRWIRNRLGHFQYPNVQNVVQVLSSLQQSPLRIHSEDEGLASLIILPQNDQWWEDLARELEYTQPYTWSISSVTSIAWVLIAYVFTLADYFTINPEVDLNTNGGSVGTLWLWLLAIVFGWLRISPKCDSVRLKAAIAKLNTCRFIANSAGGPPSIASKQIHPISLNFSKKDNARVYESITAPIFNYARNLFWVQAVMEINDTIDNVCSRNLKEEEISPGITFNNRESGGWNQLTAMQVQEYCSRPNSSQKNSRNHTYPPDWQSSIQMPRPHLIPNGYTYEPLPDTQSSTQLLQPGPETHLPVDYNNTDTLSPQPLVNDNQELGGPEYAYIGQRRRLDGSVWSRMIQASFWALLLQWGTTGAAIIIVFFTPTIGLGCRSLSFVVYGCASTLAWLMFLGSSILVFYSTDDDPAAVTHTYSARQYSKLPRIRSSLRYFAIFLRTGGKAIAGVNALLIVATSVFQFSGFYDRCYCDSCVIGLKEGAYNVITLLNSDGAAMIQSWAGGCVLSILAASIFAFYVWLLSSNLS